METVREVEPGVLLDAGPQRVLARPVHRAPAHVRNLQSLAASRHHLRIAKAQNVPRQQREPRGGPFLAVGEKHLQAQADAQERAFGGHVHHSGHKAAFVQTFHAIGHGTLPGQHDTGGGADRRRVGRHDNVAIRCHVRQRFRNRTQVAHSVVDDGNVGHQ